MNAELWPEGVFVKRTLSPSPKMIDTCNFTLGSFNCRSVKSSFDEVSNLCQYCDLVFLQEHWLLPHELYMLSNIHSDFLAVGDSSVDTFAGILIGRPYGGTSILYGKSLSSHISLINSHDSRITAIIIQTVHGPFLFICVYMPTDYSDAESYENYTETCTKITAIYEDSDAVHLIIAGDFNCHIGSRFYDIFTELTVDCNVVCTDLTRLTDTFTYCSGDALKCSWIDHMLCSPIIDKLVNSCYVHYDFVSSDHKPLILCSQTCSLLVFQLLLYQLMMRLFLLTGLKLMIYVYPSIGTS